MSKKLKKSTKNKNYNKNTNKNNINIVINNQNKKRGKGKSRSNPKETKHNIINVSPNIILPQSQQPQQTDYQGYAKNYNINKSQNPLIAQAEQPQQYYNRSEYPFLRDDISALTESDLRSYFITSYDPKFAQVYPSSINSQYSNINPKNELIHSLNSENLKFSVHPFSFHTVNSMN